MSLIAFILTLIALYYLVRRRINIYFSSFVAMTEPFSAHRPGGEAGHRMVPYGDLTLHVGQVSTDL